MVSLDGGFERLRENTSGISQDRTKIRCDRTAKSLYSDLSGGVHGRTVHDLEMRSALRKIYYEPAAAAKEVERLRKCTEAVNFLLAIFHADKIRTFAAEDRRIIMRSMPARARTIWSDPD